MEKLTLDKLESILWDAADILRGELNAAQYMDYIFGLLFLKRMNDQFDVEQEEKKTPLTFADLFKFSKTKPKD